MGKFTEAIEAEPPRPVHKGCAVGALRSRLDADDLKDFDGLIQEVMDGDRTGASVVRILTRSGVPFNADRLTYHVRGLRGEPTGCSCPTA